MGGGGVQRWLKMSKYLPDYGWIPVVYTPSNTDTANYDDSLNVEVPDDFKVIRKDIWEPFEWYKRFLGKSKNEKIQPGFLQESETNPFLQKLSVWIRGNLFIPDAKMYWIKPSIHFLTDFVKKEQIDMVISTGPPHSNHLIAKGIKRKTGIKWLADFRDPWTNIDYYDKLMLTGWADKKHRKLEKSVFEQADEVVTVSWSWAEEFFRITGRMPEVVTNGYDPLDFKGDVKYEQGDILNLTHIGSMNKDRNPHTLWQAIADLIEKGRIDPLKIRIKFIGPTDVSVFEELKNINLSDIFEYVGNLPHKEVIDHIIKSDVLLLPLNDTPNIKGVIPGKLYEYLASRRPILCIGMVDGDSAKIIRESEAGSIFDFKDLQGIQTYLLDSIMKISAGGLESNTNIPEKYSRQHLAGEMCKILDGIS